jgi:hypothetical protein
MTKTKPTKSRTLNLQPSTIRVLADRSLVAAAGGSVSRPIFIQTA